MSKEMKYELEELDKCYHKLLSFLFIKTKYIKKFEHGKNMCPPERETFHAINKIWQQKPKNITTCTLIAN